MKPNKDLCFMSKNKMDWEEESLKYERIKRECKALEIN